MKKDKLKEYGKLASLYVTGLDEYNSVKVSQCEMNKDDQFFRFNFDNENIGLCVTFKKILESKKNAKELLINHLNDISKQLQEEKNNIKNIIKILKEKQ